jgi:hypothetical protein
MKRMTVAPQDETVSESVAVNKLLELLGWEPHNVFITDESRLYEFLCMITYDTMEACQARIDEILPLAVPAQSTFAEAIGIIRQSLPQWPLPSRLN